MARKPVSEAVPILGPGLSCVVCSRAIHPVRPDGMIPCGWIFKTIILPTADTTWYAVCNDCAGANGLLEHVQ